MATFNTTTGAVTVGTTTITPLADGSNLDENYSNLISTGIQTNSPNFPKNINRINIVNFNPGADGSPSTLNSMITDTTKLPSVIMITIQNPSTKILAYVDQSGNSSFIVKVDPRNISKLVPNGVQAVMSQASPIAVVSSSSGTPWWVWLIVACVIMMFLGGVAFMISKR
jgi:hypothetical protein